MKKLFILSILTLFILPISFGFTANAEKILDNNIPKANSTAVNIIPFYVSINPETGALRSEVLQMIKQVFGVEAFVESGTYLGQTTQIAASIFSEVHTIELASEFYQKACAKFASTNHVFVHEGDSGVVLNDILPLITNRILFYLDGHYSGGATAIAGEVTPIFDEIEAIRRADKNRSIILIDDVRLFQDSAYPQKIKNTCNDGYPDLRPIVEAILDINPTYQFCFLGDAFLAFPADAQISVSEVMRACAIHRLSISFPEIPLKEIKEANDIVFQCTGNERQELVKMYNLYSNFNTTLGFRSFESLWYGLLLMNDGKNKQALEVLRNTKENSLPGWCIDIAYEKAKKLKNKKPLSF